MDDISDANCANMNAASADDALRDFLRSLSPEQMLLFQRGMELGHAVGLSQASNTSWTPATKKGTTPTTPMTLPMQTVHVTHAFYHMGCAPPTDSEVLVLAVMITQYWLARRIEFPRGLDTWQSHVDLQIVAASAMGDGWVPPKDQPVWQNRGKGGVVVPMNEAIKQSLGKGGVVETAAAVVDAWSGKGQTDQATARTIENYLKQIRTGAFKGPKRDSKGNASPRHIFALPRVAAFLREHGRQIRHLLSRHSVEPTYEPSLTKAEMQERIEDMEVEHAQTTAALQVKLTTANKAKSKAQAAAKATNATKRGTAKRVREEERAIQKEKLAMAKEVIRQQADEALRRDTERQRHLKNVANARARAAEGSLAKKHKESDARLKRLRAAEERARAAELEVEDYLEELKQAALDRERLASIPTLVPVRGAGKKRGGASFPERYVLIGMSQLARRTPPTAVGPNLVSTINYVTPWVKVQEPHLITVRNWRFDMTTLGEMCAAWQFADARKIMSFGFDESTKLHIGILSTNAQAVAGERSGVPAGTPYNIVLRGAGVIPGGTAKHVAAAIASKFFARSSKLLQVWKDEFEQRHGVGSWRGPDPAAIGYHRLGDGCVIQSDTCNGARATKRLVLEMIEHSVETHLGDEKLAAMTELQRIRAKTAHAGDCAQHLRNIFLDSMSTAAKTHLAFELEASLASFSSFDRMSTDVMQLVRAVYKELHHGGEYYKGKGPEFEVWRTDPANGFASAFYMKLERAGSGRQDLAFDASLPLFVNRPVIMPFLRSLIFTPGHSNILESFIWHVLGCREMVAFLRANVLIDLLISRPMRWLAGKSSRLKNWSIISMAGVLDLVEQTLVKAAADGHVLLDPSLDIFASIAAEQPLFALHRKSEAKRMVTAPDGTTKYAAHTLALAEAQQPKDSTNIEATEMTVELIQVMANAALQKLHDPKLALSDKLTSLNGANCVGNSADVHAATIGAHTTNDTVESNFGCYDFVLRCFQSISPEAASGVAQQMRMHHLEPADAVAHRKRQRIGEDGEKTTQKAETHATGFFFTLTIEEQEAGVAAAAKLRKETRSLARTDRKEQDEYKAFKRRENTDSALTALVNQYADAMDWFRLWESQAAVSMKTVTATLKQIESKAKVRAKVAAAKGKQVNATGDGAKREYLKRQIQMRVVGLGWSQYKCAWSSSKDASVGCVATLTVHLKTIIAEETKQRRAKALPTEAPAPVQKAMTAKQLGTPTAQIGELAETSRFSMTELKSKADAEMTRREEAGTTDNGEMDPAAPAPALDQSLVGKMIEVRYKYFALDDHGKVTKTPVFIWCSGEVIEVADGESAKQSERCTKLLPAGAVHVKWPADADFGEEEHFSWMILHPAKWNREVHNGWRLDESEHAL